MKRVLLVALLGAATLGLTGCEHLGPGQVAAKHSSIVYTVNGHGSAVVQYAAHGTAALTSKTVTLPWKTTANATDHSRTVYEVSSKSPNATGCSIVVNGTNVFATKKNLHPGVSCTFIK